MVRGERNQIYRRLLNKYRALINPALRSLPVSEADQLHKSLWLVRTASGYVGTAFLLKGEGLVTCRHVIGRAGSQFWVSRPDNLTSEYPGQVLRSSIYPDLAVIEPNGLPLKEELALYGLDIGESLTISMRKKVRTAGFPNFHPGDSGVDFSAEVSGFVGEDTVFDVRRFVIDRGTYKGMSGSPVVDEGNQVVGVVVVGAETNRDAGDVWNYACTPIHHIKNIG
jgi:S1-C subfamily serine protease